jgi:cytochrome c oxidase assembly protein subunit 15
VPAPADASVETRAFDRLRALGARIADWIGRFGRPLTLANVFLQGAIIVTGGAVRLTGSGLGCSTWPQCEPGSFTPAFTPETGYHAFVEFGNRLITFVLLLVAGLLAIAIWRTRRDLLWWGLAPLIGVVVQAILGGITVLADLHPAVVAPHLLISTLLVWLAVQLSLRYRRAPRREGRCIRKRLRLLTALTAVVVVLGALTTGAGPHSGDAEATLRLALDPVEIARVHAVAVWAFVVVLLWVIWGVRRDRSAGVAQGFNAAQGFNRDEVRPAWIVLLAATLAQGAIGYAQFFTGLPILLVGAHLAGAAILVAAQSAAYYLLRRASSPSALVTEP